MRDMGPDSNVCLVGHPFAPIGRGEDVRCSFRALRSVAARPALLDIYRHNTPDADAWQEFGGALRDEAGGINVFHLNGDEVDASLATLSGRIPAGAYNIVYPAWELSRYPQEWARQLDRFDEIWAPSRFILDALAPVVTRPLLHMPLACEVVLSSLRSRRYFGIPESAYAFLFFFDFRSYVSRKNPYAVIRAFEALCRARPMADTCLVVKVNGSEAAPRALAELRAAVAPLRGRVVLIEQSLSDNDTKNLVRLCDCFVSLHRSEGFGRGLAEAMYLGKPVVATAYSGNLDFMDADTALLVPYQLVPVGEGEYPHADGQAWAEADVERATAHMQSLLDDPAAGRVLGHRASLAVRAATGLRAAGLRYVARLDAVVTARADRRSLATTSS